MSPCVAPITILKPKYLYPNLIFLNIRLFSDTR
nr:MAG TPA: hypothetical protein [Caudoviricetes sp.]